MKCIVQFDKFVEVTLVVTVFGTLQSLSIKTLDMKEPIVETQDGSLRGVIKYSIENDRYYAFLGVPYAKPPVRNLRFKDPEPPEKWSGVRDATEFGEMCLQYNYSLRSFEGSEDCLHINIYTKRIEETNKIKVPVMVWVHGGGFTFGAANDALYGPDYLMRKDVVLVTVTYRFGIFGFLNLEDEIAPGNMGLKDIIMALRWVQANIEKFGGDPNNVTIFGESTGAVSIHYLLLSSLAKGLFHKAICQSGNALTPFARVKYPKKSAYKICELLEEYPLDIEELYDILRDADAMDLVKAQQEIVKNNIKFHLEIAFGPGIDDKSPNPVMPIAVEEAALEGVHIPFILGYNSCDGMCYLIDHADFTEQKKKEYDEANYNFANMVMPENIEPLLERYNMTMNDLKNMYYQNEKISISNCHIFANLSTDVQFVEAVHRAVKIQVETNSHPTYVYKFSHCGDMTLMRAILQNPPAGACHFDEIEYLFFSNRRVQVGFKPLPKNSDGYRVMEKMTEMWTNFAAYGIPTPDTSSETSSIEWLPVDDSRNIRYLNIDKDMRMETTVNVEERFLSYTRSKSNIFA